ncbi:MAG: hypothetical protein V2I67_06665 [Thermoanaerobaculales bacterium]|nr:hypothetical protein [Thermoanaerobaculales bacterium]
MKQLDRDHGRWKVDRGSYLGGLRFEAPDTPGDMTITLDVLHGTTWIPVDVATVQVTDEGCMVKLTEPRSGMEAVFRLDEPTRTQITADGTTMLVDLPHVYIEDKKWKRLDLRKLDSVMGMFGGMKRGPSYAKGAFGDIAKDAKGLDEIQEVTQGIAAAGSYNLPQVLRVLFDHDRMAQAAEAGSAPDGNIELSEVPCEDGEGTCDRITLVTADGNAVLDYDSRDRLIRTEAGGTTLSFSYGDFPMMEPPARYKELRMRPW